MVLVGTEQEVFLAKRAKAAKKRRSAKTATESPARERILCAALAAFIERGYAETSTLEIATRARVSKRELYAHFSSKSAMLTTAIAGRAAQMRPPPELPEPSSRDALAALLVEFGKILLREVSHPHVTAVFRLAISEAARSPEVARALHTAGREANRAALAGVVANAQAAGLLGAGDPAELAQQFQALLWGDLMVVLLLRVAEPPSTQEIERRARRAAAAFLELHPVAPG